MAVDKAKTAEIKKLLKDAKSTRHARTVSSSPVALTLGSQLRSPELGR